MSPYPWKSQRFILRSIQATHQWLTPHSEKRGELFKGRRLTYVGGKVFVSLKLVRPRINHDASAHPRRKRDKTGETTSPSASELQPVKKDINNQIFCQVMNNCAHLHVKLASRQLLSSILHDNNATKSNYHFLIIEKWSRGLTPFLEFLDGRRCQQMRHKWQFKVIFAD